MAIIFNNRYADDTVLMPDSEGKLKELLNKAVKESEKKGPTINCKKVEYMVVSSKCKRYVLGTSNSSRYKNVTIWLVF